MKFKRGGKKQTLAGHEIYAIQFKPAERKLATTRRGVGGGGERRSNVTLRNSSNKSLSTLGDRKGEK